MHKITAELLIKISIVLFVLTIIICLLVGCGDNPAAADINNDFIPPTVQRQQAQPYCGDLICDERGGEDYWNCLDCVDLNGWPTHGYCGDGVCYKESMVGCWEDCRPIEINTDALSHGPNGPLPDPPIYHLQAGKFHHLLYRRFQQGE